MSTKNRRFELNTSTFTKSHGKIQKTHSDYQHGTGFQTETTTELGDIDRGETAINTANERGDRVLDEGRRGSNKPIDSVHRSTNSQSRHRQQTMVLLITSQHGTPSLIGHHAVSGQALN